MERRETDTYNTMNVDFGRSFKAKIPIQPREDALKETLNLSGQGTIDEDKEGTVTGMTSSSRTQAIGTKVEGEDAEVGLTKTAN